MVSDLARDHAFTIAWFGLMTLVWLGWGQEAPPRRWRWRLGAGSALGLLLVGVFGFGVVRRWGEATALEGRYGWFGVLVLLEVLVAGIGCLVLWRKGETRWMAWWVAVVVALHFVPLAFLLDDWSLTVLGLGQLALLLVIRPRLKVADDPTSVLVGPVMGATLLAFALVSASVFLVKVGSPW